MAKTITMEEFGSQLFLNDKNKSDYTEKASMPHK